MRRYYRLTTGGILVAEFPVMSSRLEGLLLAGKAHVEMHCYCKTYMYCVRTPPLQSEPHANCWTDKETDRILAVFATTQTIKTEITLISKFLKFINFHSWVSADVPIPTMDHIMITARQSNWRFSWKTRLIASVWCLLPPFTFTSQNKTKPLSRSHLHSKSVLYNPTREFSGHDSLPAYFWPESLFF